MIFVYADYSREISEKFPHGVYCPCGLVIHLGESEASNAVTAIRCPKCGFRIRYIRNPSLMMIRKFDIMRED